ncbi:hypothetical protein E1263_21315 [Kribbella antibiotica]|uniref:DUF8094 domain-containing protein n=1 Tax=Kribbella antibiotica TaxID=190195 RepID=A0A4R4ZHL1_9ACTN|nr:hypothetical protein [Kribbella antibiotica]TDD57915.1 hypothetical protein E1263_21315 [Kribbella antibiotica]
MRFARTALGLLLTLIGLVVGVAGAAAAFWLVGPDNTISTGGRALTSDGLAVVTAPDLLDRHGPTLRVSVTGSKPLFVGIAQDLDVADYLSGAAHTRVIRYDVPSTVSTQTMNGFSNKLTPPADLDWWVAKSGGTGNQSIAWPMQDGRYSVVVMNADGTPAVDAKVSFGIELHRSFGISLLVLGAGIVALALGIALAFRRPSADRSDEPAAAELAGTPMAAGPVVARSANPFAPANRVLVEDVPAYRAPEVRAKEQALVDETTETLAVIAAAAPTAPTASVQAAPAQKVSAQVGRAQVAPVRPIPGVQPLRSAPMLMSPAAVARAKSRATLPTAPAVPVAAAPAARAESAPAPSAESAPPAETLPLDESPEFVKSDEAVKRTAALLASGALLLTATSCGLMPPKNNLTLPDRRPAVTIADAKAVVTKYNELNNKANAARDSKLAAAIEAEPNLAQTLAGYQIGRKLDRAGKAIGKPFTFTNPVVGAPEFTAYPMRFVVTSGVSDAADTRQLGVWERESAGAPWLLTHSVYPGRSIDLPAMEGVRTPSRADIASLATHPAAVAPTLAAYLSGGPKAPQSKLFTTSPGMAKLMEQRAKSKVADAAESYIAAVSDTYKATGTPVTFMTADGEGLVFLGLTEQYLQRVEPGSNAYWTSGEATAFSSNVKFTQTLHQDYLHQVALVIPAKATGGPIRILSMDGQLVGAGGS